MFVKQVVLSSLERNGMNFIKRLEKHCHDTCNSGKKFTDAL